MLRLLLPVSAFLGLHVIAALGLPLPLWGADVLAFYPRWVVIPFAIAAGMLQLPAAADKGMGLLTRITPHLARLPAQSLLLAFAGLTLFVALSSAAHLLGDGSMLLNELPHNLRLDNFRVDRAPLLFWLLRELYSVVQPLGLTAEATFRLYSYASGFAYLLLVFPVSRAAGKELGGGALVAVFLLTPACLQLFCGYIETYPLLATGLLLYLWCGLLVLRGSLSPAWSAGLLGVLLACHFMFVTLVPSLVYLVWRRRQNSGSLLALALTPTLFAAILQLLEVSPLSFVMGQPEGHLLPLLASPQPDLHAYRLLDTAHLLDYINLLLLVAPAPFLALFYVRSRDLSNSEEKRFALVTALPLLLLAFTANARIGLFRDWDAFSLGALPLAIWAGLALSSRQDRLGGTARAGFVLGGAALIHTGLWLGVNSHDGMAVARFRNALEYAPLSLPASAYGWETLGAHERDSNAHESALYAYQKAISCSPTNPRYWVAAGDQQFALGRFDQAGHSFEQAISIRPTLAYAWNRLGVTQAHRSRPEESLTALGRATELAPDDAGFLYDLCLGHNRAGHYRAALSACERAAAISPESAHVRNQLIAAAVALGQLELARLHYTELRRFDPHQADRIVRILPRLQDTIK